MLALVCSLAALGCEPDLVVGTWRCPTPPRKPPPGGGALVPVTDPVSSPWSTGFETGLCQWDEAQGFCYADDNADVRVVSSPAHSGTRAISFSIVAGDSSGQQVRCVREGVLPVDATYGAWFYVPALASNPDNWNLMHWQGSNTPGKGIKGLFDVSLQVADDGGLAAVLFRPPQDMMASTSYAIVSPIDVPIGSWFHLELRLLRRADATGEVDLYQDGRLVAQRQDVVTDDTAWGQWYVGNLAYALDPPESTIYVDDVSIRPAN